jgi:hypothetical protein
MGSSHRKLPPAVSEPAPDARAVYVYCVVRGKTTASPSLIQTEPRLPEAGEPQALKLASRTWAIATEVPLSVYGTRAIEARLKDLDWVSACGVAHQAMVDACMRSNDAVVPMKVFTIFKSVLRARGELKRHGVQLRELMAQVAGCVEWGVRVTRAPQPRRELERQIAHERIAARVRALEQPSGTEFLEAKARERVAVRDLAAEVDQHVRALAETLGGVTRDVRYRQDTVRGPVPVLLDAAYLVPRRSEERFRAQVRLKSRPLLAIGCRVTVTGPWPAYSFVSPAGR